MNFTFRQHGSLLPARHIVLAGLLVFGTLLSFAAHPAIPLDDWRSEFADLRVMAENDAPQAYREAQLLQKEIPAGATLADRARLLNLLSRIELHLALISDSVRHSAEAKSLARQGNDADGQIEADLNIALGAINQGRLDDMIAATQDGMGLLETIQRDDLRAEMMFQAAMMYLRFGQIEEMTTVAMQALEVAKNVDDPRVRAYAEQSMGVAYVQSGRYADARRHYRNMLDAARQAHLKLLEAAALLGLSAAADGMGDSNEAERLIAESVELFRRVDAPFYVSHAQHQLADMYVRNNQPGKALPLIDDNAKIYEEHQNPIGLWWTLQARSRVLQALGRLDTARGDAGRAYALAQKIGFNVYMSGSAQRLAEVIAAQGDYKEAYRWSAEAAVLKEKSDREKSGKRILDQAKRFQEESKQRRIDELNRHNELQHARQRQMQIGLAAVLILLSVTVYFLLRLRKSREEIRSLNVGLEQRVLERTVELLESRQSLAEAQRIAHVGSWENNLADNILTWSDEVYRIFEIDPQQFGASYEAFMEVVHPDDRRVLDSAFKASLENREPFEIEHRLLLPDGRIKYVHEHCETSYDADGRPLRSLGTVQDITERKEMENALRESRQMLTEAQRIAHVGSWDLDLVSNKLNWSDECQRIFEIDPQQVSVNYEVFLDTIHPEDRDTVNRVYLASLENRTPYEIVHRLLFPDGRIKYVHEHCETFYSADGRPLRSIGTTQDITERMEIENALHESRQLLTEAQRIAHVGSWEYDISSDTHTWSEELFRIYEIDPVKEGASYEGCFNATHPDDRDAITRAYLESVETGQPYESEHRLLMADGRIKHVHERCETIRGPDGTLLRAVGMMQDITARKHIEEALAARERELRALAESSPGMVGSFHLRPDGSIYMPYVSPNIYDLFGLHPQDVAEDATPLMKLNHPDDAQRVVDTIAESARTMTPWHCEYRILHPVKGERWMEGNTNPQPHPDGGTIWYGFVHDITERKRAEEVLRFIAQGEWLNSGEVFLNALVRYLGKVLDVDYVMIDRIAADPAYAETAALYAYGEVVPNMRYALHDTPCANVMSGSLCFYRENVQGLFPEDVLLAEMRAESYAGLPLRDTKGEVIGLIAVLDGKPIRDKNSVESILQLVATSAAAELNRSQMEQVLRESLDSLAEAQRIAHVGSWELDHASNTLTWSGESYRIFEIDPQQFGGTYEAFLEAVHPEDRERVNQAFSESVSKRAPYEIEHRLSFADGRIKYVHERCETICGADGNELRSIGTVQDITERKRMEAALQESEARYRYHFNQLQSMLESAASVSVFALDREYRYLFFNNRHREGAKRLRGTDIEIGMNMVETIPDPEFREFCRRGFDRVLAGHVVSVESKEKVVKDGVTIYEYNDNYGSPIFNDQGEVVGLTVFAINTTERKRLEAELRESHTFLNSVIDAVPDPIFVKDRQHNWLLLNEAFCRFTALPHEALIGKSDYEIFPKKEADLFWEKDELVFGSGEVNLNEESFTSANGEKHFIQTKKTPFVSADGNQMLVGVIRDITERIHYETAREAALAEAQRLANLRSEFIAHMSHELRTPLNGILGYAQMLGRDGKLDEKQHASMDVIRQSGEHLLALIDDILDLARIESGKLELDMSDIPLARFLNVVAGIVGVRAKQKQLEFVCEFASDLPEGIRGDEKRLCQVLLNLLSNAVKFTDQGRVTLSVSRVMPSRLAFAVADTGIGIESSERETIFQSFEQVSDTQHRQGGTGLGLSISRQLVRLMGGDIAVESRLGEGSIFRFELELPEVSIEPDVLRMPAADTQHIEPDGENEPAGLPQIVPPQEELQALHRLALLGNMRDIANYAERMATLDPRYWPFAEHLKRLANSYQSKAILAFVEMHLLQQDTPGGGTRAWQDLTIDPNKGDVI